MTPHNVRSHTSLLSLLAFIMALPCFAAVYYVDGDTGVNAKDGLSWATAKKSLQDGIETAAAAANGPHEVWVKAGTYVPDSWPNILGNTLDRDKHFSLRNNVAVYGGFAGTETDRTARDPGSNVCILSGDIGIAADDTDNCYHVFYHPDHTAHDVFNHPGGTTLDATAILDGFTVSGGNANGGSYPHSSGGGILNDRSSPTLTDCTISANTASVGGGMHNANVSSPTLTNCTISANTATWGGGTFNTSASSPTMTDCTISGNAATRSGGGMYNQSASSPTLTNCTLSGNSTTDSGGGMSNASSSPALINCTISENRATAGGGMYNSASSPILTNCTISANSASNNGGGMLNVYSSSPNLTNCSISENTADFSGGGMSNISSSPALTNCTISENTVTTSGNGGGMSNTDSSSPTLTNCTISANATANSGSGGGIYNSDNSSPMLTNCIVWGNGSEIYNFDITAIPVVMYSIIEGGYPGDNNSGNDPKLGPLQDNGGLVQTIAIGAGSPAIGAAIGAAAPAADARGITRDGSPDIGAFEAVPLIFLRLSATSVNESDGTITGTVTRVSSGTAGPLTVTLSSSDANEATVPTFVKIPDTQVSVDFTITLIDDATVGPNPQLTITGSAAGHVGDTSPAITIADDAPLTLTILESSGGAADSSGNTTVLSDPDSTAPILLSATPSVGYHFVDWTVLSGIAALNSDEPITTVILFTDAEIQANFALDNDPPVAVGSAYPSPTTVGTTVTLSGSGSYDPDNAPVSPITYLWSFVYATPETIVAPTITNATAMDASFTPTEVGTYVFQLTVSDGVLTDSDVVQVVVGDLHIITANAGTGGTVRFGLYGIAGTSVAEGVPDGADSSYLFALPDTGYEFTGWDDLDANNPRLFENVTADDTVTATFVLKSYTVTFSSFTGGTLSGTTPQTVDYGTDCSAVTATADKGYVFLRWTLNGAEASTDATLTVTNVQTDETYVAVFEKKSKSSIIVIEEDSGCSIGGSNGISLPIILLLVLVVCLRGIGAANRGRKSSI